MFEVPVVKNDASNCEVLECSNNEPLSQNITDLPCSPALFEASDIPSCTNSFELSPPITSKMKKEPISAVRSFNEHSLGVSMFDSSSFKDEDTFLFCMQNNRNIESPPIVFSNRTKTIQKDCSSSQKDENFFMSPPMTSDTKRISFNLSKTITQSTPIVNSKKPTQRDVLVSPTEDLLLTIFGNTDKGSSFESNVDLNDYKEDEANDNDLSPTLFQASDRIIQTEKDNTLEKSDFDIKDLPLNFEVESFGKSKSFNYPTKRNTTTSCLDSISVIKETGMTENNDVFIKKEDCSKTVKEEHSSLIDMDQLTQLPLHSIVCPSPLKIQNISPVKNNSKILEPKKLVESDKIDNNSKLTTPFTGFQTAKGKSVKISDSVLKAAKQKFDTDEIDNNSKSATPFTGFQTAKGKSVKISDSALKAAKLKFDGDEIANNNKLATLFTCLLYTSPSPRDATLSRMPSSA